MYTYQSFSVSHELDTKFKKNLLHLCFTFFDFSLVCFLIFMKLVNNKKIYSKMKLENIINTNLYPLDDQDSERYKKLLDELR